MRPELAGDGARHELEEEARYLHRSFFRGEPPQDVVERYVAANQLCCPAAGNLMGTIVSRQLDAEAIELALRGKGAGILTKKIHILFYLLEVRSAYYGFFVGEGQTRCGAVLCLGATVARSALKYVKGACLVRRYGLF